MQIGKRRWRHQRNGTARIEPDHLLDKKKFGMKKERKEKRERENGRPSAVVKQLGRNELTTAASDSGEKRELRKTESYVEIERHLPSAHPLPLSVSVSLSLSLSSTLPFTT